MKKGRITGQRMGMGKYKKCSKSESRKKGEIRKEKVDMREELSKGQVNGREKKRG